MKQIVRWALLIIVFLSTLLLFRVPIVSAVESNKVIKIGVYDNRPKIYREESGKISGFFADILDFIAIQENWKIDYIFGTFNEGLNRLENGGIDIMVDVAYSEDRAKKYEFTNETVLGSWGLIYVRKTSDIDSFDDLNHKKIGILKSSVYLEGEQGLKAYVNSFGIKVEFVEIEEYADIFSYLERGDIDAAVVSRIFGVTNEKDHPGIRATNIFFSPTELRFALRKNNPDNAYYINRIDYWLNNIKEGYQNFYRDSLEKYGLLGMAPEKEVVPSWLRVLGPVAVGLFLLSLLINLLLKRERELTKRDLMQRESLLGTVVENTPLFISSANRDGKITMFAGQGTGMAKYLPKNVIGKSVFEIFKDNKTIIENFNKAVSGEPVVFQTEVAKRIWMIHLSPIKEYGKVASVVGTAFDYSEEQKIEKERMEFIHVTSHHLRTNPTEIKWNLKLLEPRIKSKLDKEGVELWKSIDQANNGVIELANTLSLCSWLELTTFKVSNEEFDLAKLINSELERQSALIKKNKLKVETGFPDLKKIYSDKNKLTTVLRTLITNAVKYNLPGGKIKIGFKEVGDDILITVRDTGIGIIPKEQQMIFTRFSRGSNAVKHHPYGIGLSLYISKLIVERLGGHIWFESEKDSGTSFFVRIPLLGRLV